MSILPYISIIISFGVFIAFLASMIAISGIPESFSDFYYRLEQKRKGAGWIFTITCWVIALSMLPSWVACSGENIQFLAFLAAVGLCFVGGAPQFKDIGLARIVHFSGAITWATATVLWLIFSSTWWCLLAAPLFAIIALFNKKRWLFWLEMAVPIPIYSALLLTIYLLSL